jgi:hypothetical protein
LDTAQAVITLSGPIDDHGARWQQLTVIATSAAHLGPPSTKTSLQVNEMPATVIAAHRV